MDLFFINHRRAFISTIFIIDAFCFVPSRVMASHQSCVEFFHAPRAASAKTYLDMFQNNKEIRVKEKLFSNLSNAESLGLTPSQIDMLQHSWMEIYASPNQINIDIVRDDVEPDLIYKRAQRIGHLHVRIWKDEHGILNAEIGHMGIGTNIDLSASPRDSGLGLSKVMMQKLVDMVGRDAIFQTELAGDNRAAFSYTLSRLKDKESAFYRPDLSEEQIIRMALESTPAYKARKRVGIGRVVEPIKATLSYIVLTVTNDHLPVKRVEGLEPGDLKSVHLKLFSKLPDSFAEMSFKDALSEFLRLRDSNKIDERLKFAENISVAEAFSQRNIYPKSSFERDLFTIVKDSANPFELKKTAYFSLILLKGSSYKYLVSGFSEAEQKVIRDEISAWRSSKTIEKYERSKWM